MSELQKRLRSCGVIPESLGREAADALDALVEETSTQAQEIARLRARAEAAEKDAARYRWLTQDHDDPWVRQHCRELIGRMGTMSYSATSMAIDAALEIDAARGGA